MDEMAVAGKDAALTVAVGDNMFFNVQMFEHAQRVAKMICSSTMVPEHFRGPQNLGNVMIAMNYAQRVRADVFMVMQSLYVVHGRPGIEAKLVIALVNQCGRFEPLQFEADNDGCLAYAKEIKSGKILKGPKVTWAMVKSEGWLSKNGSKWQSMPDLMFRYRSAAFFARTYCPEVLLGMHTKDELEDIIPMEPTHEQGRRTWKISEEPPTAFEYQQFRESLIAEGLSEQAIDSFESRLSSHYQRSIQEIRQQIGDDPEGFRTSVRRWAEQQSRSSPQRQAQDVPGNGQEDARQATTNPIPEAPSAADLPQSPNTEEANLRDEFTRLRYHGLKTWVLENADRIRTASPDIQAEIRAKWNRLYGQEPFPMDNNVSQQKGDIAKLLCPIWQREQSVTYCSRSCDNASKCQPYQEYRFEHEGSQEE